MPSAGAVADWLRMSDEEVLRRFERITVWKAGGQRAPHKPLLLLWALARLVRGEGRLAGFAEVDGPLRRLLAGFGPPRRSYHPEYPFWHLQSDGLWEIPEREALEAVLARRVRKNNPAQRALLAEGAQGGLPQSLVERLRGQHALVNRVVQALLDGNFPRSVHEELLDAVGMPWVPVVGPRVLAFRETVLRIYERRCAVCGFDGQLGGSDLCLDAAHVRWHAAGGPDSEDNGLALCSFHHRAFDRGALSLDAGLRVLVSQHARGGAAIEEWLLRFAGRRIVGPQRGTPPPAERHLAWHRREVFLGPARAAAG